jgi:hypothetical protein
MRVPGIAPVLDHAETHPGYLPRPGIDRLQMAAGVAEDIRRHKAENPADNIHDRLVDSLVGHVRSLVAGPARQAEDPGWTPPQRIVWRSAAEHRGQLPLAPERKLAVIADHSVHATVRAFAYVNAGRWVVSCPFPGCNSAQMASFTDRRYFCCDCANAAVGGAWVEVVWPENHTEVENWVASRPFDVRHWVPGETAEDIAAQDAEALGRGFAGGPAAPGESVATRVARERQASPRSGRKAKV